MEFLDRNRNPLMAPNETLDLGLDKSTPTLWRQSNLDPDICNFLKSYRAG